MKTPRRLLTVVVGVVAVLVALVLGRAAARLVVNQRVSHSLRSDARPVAVLPGAQRNLGTIPADTLTSVEFPLKNAGSRRLILSREDDGCCGDAQPVEQIIIEPGRSVALRVKVDTRGSRPDVRETARYTTNDPDLPYFLLTVTATVDAPPRIFGKPRLADTSP